MSKLEICLGVGGGGGDYSIKGYVGGAAPGLKPLPFNPQMYKQTHTPTVVQGGVDGTPPLGFCCVSIFWRDFGFGRKPLLCSTGIYYGLGHCWGPVTSSKQIFSIVKKKVETGNC